MVSVAFVFSFGIPDNFFLLVDEMSLNFPALFIIEKYVRTRSKNMGHHAIFRVLEIRRPKILQKSNKRYCLGLHSWFHFYGISRAKTDLHNKYLN